MTYTLQKSRRLKHTPAASCTSQAQGPRCLTSQSILLTSHLRVYLVDTVRWYSILCWPRFSCQKKCVLDMVTMVRISIVKKENVAFNASNKRIHNACTDCFMKTPPNRYATFSSTLLVLKRMWCVLGYILYPWVEKKQVPVPGHAYKSVPVDTRTYKIINWWESKEGQHV